MKTNLKLMEVDDFEEATAEFEDEITLVDRDYDDILHLDPDEMNMFPIGTQVTINGCAIGEFSGTWNVIGKRVCPIAGVAQVAIEQHETRAFVNYVDVTELGKESFSYEDWFHRSTTAIGEQGELKKQTQAIRDRANSLKIRFNYNKERK